MGCLYLLNRQHASAFLVIVMCSACGAVLRLIDYFVV